MTGRILDGPDSTNGIFTPLRPLARAVHQENLRFLSVSRCGSPIRIGKPETDCECLMIKRSGVSDRGERGPAGHSGARSDAFDVTPAQVELIRTTSETKDTISAPKISGRRY